MIRSKLLAAALLAILLSTKLAANDLTQPPGCQLPAPSIESQLAVSRLARIHGQTGNFSPRPDRTYFSWNLAGNLPPRQTVSAAICTRCEP